MNLVTERIEDNRIEAEGVFPWRGRMMDLMKLSTIYWCCWFYLTSTMDYASISYYIYVGMCVPASMVVHFLFPFMIDSKKN